MFGIDDMHGHLGAQNQQKLAGVWAEEGVSHLGLPILNKKIGLVVPKW